jgi:uncharacterized protein YrrD
LAWGTLLLMILWKNIKKQPVDKRFSARCCFDFFERALTSLLEMGSNADHYACAFFGEHQKCLMENVALHLFSLRSANYKCSERWGQSLRTFSLVKGLPVFELTSGSILGEVSDLCISGNGKVEGLLVKKKALFHKQQFIDIKNIASFGPDGVMVRASEVLEPVSRQPVYTLEHQRKLSGKMMMSAEGEKLGLVEDVYFLEELGTIVGYECSDGFFSDMMEGKRVIKTVHPPAIGKDTIIVDVETM